MKGRMLPSALKRLVSSYCARMESSKCSRPCSATNCVCAGDRKTGPFRRRSIRQSRARRQEIEAAARWPEGSRAVGALRALLRCACRGRAPGIQPSSAERRGCRQVARWTVEWSSLFDEILERCERDGHERAPGRARDRRCVTTTKPLGRAVDVGRRLNGQRRKKRDDANAAATAAKARPICPACPRTHRCVETVRAKASKGPCAPLSPGSGASTLSLWCVGG